jgi:hypothetical protein
VRRTGGDPGEPMLHALHLDDLKGSCTRHSGAFSDSSTVVRLTFVDGRTTVLRGARPATEDESRLVDDEGEPPPAGGFCFPVPMTPLVHRVELIDAGHILLSLDRPRAPTEAVVVEADDSPTIAVAYEEDAARYALATMRVALADRSWACSTESIGQRTNSGFLGLARRCWSWWQGHFETEDEIDPGNDHWDYYFRDPRRRPTGNFSRRGSPTVLLITDAFYRRTYPLKLLADCGVRWEAGPSGL